PPRAVVAAHQRCAERGHAAARLGCPAVPDHLDAAWRDGAAARAHALPALQEARRRTGRRSLAHADRAVSRRPARAGPDAGGLPGMPDDGLLRPRRLVRDHDAVADTAPADPRR